MIVEPAQDFKTLKSYLQQRGLTNELIYSKVGIEIAGPLKCREVLGLPKDSMDKRLGIIFHYPIIEGEEPYATVRWFGRYVGSFGQIAEHKLQCPNGRPVRAYVSPLAELDDAGDVFICESVLKAIVLSQTGRYSIGGNGVSCFYVRGQFVPGFPVEAIDRAKRVIILFDNDVRTNPSVAAARRLLTKGLRDRWADLEILWGDLPDPPNGGKWGVDDYIASGGKIEDIKLEEAAATDVEKLIDELNEKYCVCEHPPAIIKKDTGQLYTRAEFTGLLEAHKKVWLGEKLVEGSRLWLADSTRSVVPQCSYLPGRDPFVEREFYNFWRDTGPVAAEGDISPFLRVYENAIPDDKIRTLLFQSFAWILQNRGTKLEKTFIFVSRQVGTGKSLLAQTISRILGPSNSSNIDMVDFSNDFNSSFAQKELVIIDDLHKVSKGEVAKLKRYTTSPRIMVNAKNVKQYEVDNTAVFILTTNELGSIPMDDAERRNLVVSFEPKIHYTGESSWWKEYIGWLEADGLASLRFWLEHMDLSSFDPYYMPPMNDIKSKMVSSARSGEENFAYDLYQDPEVFLHKTGRSIFTTEELWFVWTNSMPDRGDLIRLGRALGDKFNQVGGGKFVRLAGRKPNRYWIIRNREDEWQNKAAEADLKEWPDISA
jgi:hypothetical protein